MLPEQTKKDKPAISDCAPRRARLIATLASALAAILTSALAAEGVTAETVAEKHLNAENDNWYQIEVIVFTNRTPGNSTLEDWSRDLELGYPDSLTFLNHLEQHPERHPQQQQPDQQATPAQELLTGNDDLGTTEAMEPHLTPENSAIEIPFITLPEEQRTQNAEAKRLQRAPYFDVVFHEAWRQPVLSRETPTHIPIIQGQQFDEHFELEGFISLSKNRYLHFESHLWLNEFEAITDEYAILQKPITVTDSEVMDAKVIDSEGIPVTASELVLETKLLDEKTVTVPPVPEPPVFAEESIDQKNIDATSEQAVTPAPEDEQWVFENESQYRVTRTVILQEHRRMRSKELHYLDHPLFGVVVMITPYELPKPEEVELPIDEPEADSLEDLLKTAP